MASGAIKAWACTRVCRWTVLLVMLLSGPMLARAESICAVVKIEIRQELTFERQAFEAHLRVSNGLDTLAIEHLAVDVLFEDEDGRPVTASFDPNRTDAAFFIRPWSMDGTTAVDGTGTVAPAGSADIRWLIIPAPGAGGSLPSGKLYFVGARIGYTLGGEAMEAKVAPDFIYVRPLPLLTLDYFLTADVFADDPFTDAIEPIEPFTLGVRVRNNGQGAAKDLSIDSAAPKIVENKQGLLIDFRIIGSTINEAPSTPSLFVGFGDLAPGASTMARWIMETTLAGRFVDFTAEFSHADTLGGDLTSIIDEANTHFLIRDVLVDLPGRDAVRDFLALDGDIKRVYESSGLDTEVTDQTATARLAQGANGRDELTFPETAGFVYVRLPDPYRGTKQIAQAFRDDGKEIRPENVWFSKTRNRDNDTWQYWFNLFDVNSSGAYVLAVEDIVIPPSAPVMQFIPDRRTHEGGRLGFVVEASDPNGTAPAITAAPLPPGATFRDETESKLATYAFDWTVALGQAQMAADGTYTPYRITFTATDGVLATSQAAEILVCPAWDTDCDRMADAWELGRFGSLVRHGSGDFDGDGISDLDEYLRGTQTPLTLKPGLNLIAYPYAAPPTHADCRGLLAALGATGTSDGLARLNAATGRLETCTAASGVGFPIVPGEAYAIQVEAAHHLLLQGTPVCAAPDLAPGVNLRGHPLPAPGLGCYGWLRALGVGQVSAIARFDVEGGRFETCAFAGEGAAAVPVGVDFPILRGEGYRLTAPVGGALVLPGCP